MNNTTTTTIKPYNPTRNPTIGIIIFFVIFVTISFGGLLFFTFDYLCCYKRKNNTKQTLLETIDKL